MRHLILPCLFAVSSAHAQTKVLFLGNSYTTVNNLPNTFRQLALSLGDTVTTSMQAPGGYTLGGHMQDAGSLAAINAQDWDYVVLQEQSQWGALPFPATGMYTSAHQLALQIEWNHECTYPVFYMTWGRENGDDFFCNTWPYMCTYDGMQWALRYNYLEVAEATDSYVAPVGSAWKVVRDTQPQINLYDADGSHPSMEGTYLAACVLYCTIFQESCDGAAFNASIEQGTAAVLRSIATATVMDSIATWNLDVPNGTSAEALGTSIAAENALIFYHMGQGTHWWETSDGQTSTEQTPTFFFPGPGLYTITHIYNDPCGNTDTATWEQQVGIGTAIEETTEHLRYGVWSSGPGMVEISGAGGNEQFTLFDLQGRTIVSQRLCADRTGVACPAGVYVWMIGDVEGRSVRGKLVVR